MAHGLHPNIKMEMDGWIDRLQGLLSLKCKIHCICIHIAMYYSTGVQIVSYVLSDDTVLSESTGLFNPVLCVSQ